MLDPSPCKPDCPRRCAICHAQCEDYDKWQKRRRQQTEEVRRRKDKDVDADGFLIAQSARIRRKSQDDYRQRQKGATKK